MLRQWDSDLPRVVSFHRLTFSCPSGGCRGPSPDLYPRSRHLLWSATTQASCIPSQCYVGRDRYSVAAMSIDATITLTKNHDVDVKLVYLSPERLENAGICRESQSLSPLFLLLKQKIGLFDYKQASPEPRLGNWSAVRFPLVEGTLP